jgi:aryl-alcohol dehydrogenase-like predicted oxidoreductase
MNAETWAWHRRTRMPVFAYSAQAKGFFSGMYRPGVSPADAKAARVLDSYATEQNFSRLGRAEELGARYGCSANEIALAYLLAQPFPTFPVIGPRSAAQARSSFEASSVCLSDEDVRFLTHDRPFP